MKIFKTLRPSLFNKYVFLLCLTASVAGCNEKSGPNNSQEQQTEETTADWSNYFVGDILFYDEAPATEGSRIYHSIIPVPQNYIAEQARTVLATLYFSPEDSIVPVLSLIHI